MCNRCGAEGYDLKYGGFSFLGKTGFTRLLKSRLSSSTFTVHGWLLCALRALTLNLITCAVKKYHVYRVDPVSCSLVSPIRKRRLCAGSAPFGYTRRGSEKFSIVTDSIKQEVCLTGHRTDFNCGFSGLGLLFYQTGFTKYGLSSSWFMVGYLAPLAL